MTTGVTNFLNKMAELKGDEKTSTSSSTTDDQKNGDLNETKDLTANEKPSASSDAETKVPSQNEETKVPSQTEQLTELGHTEEKVSDSDVLNEQDHSDQIPEGGKAQTEHLVEHKDGEQQQQQQQQLDGIEPQLEKHDGTQQETADAESDSSPGVPLDSPGRLQLYERGQELLDKGKTTAALKNFLKCLAGLDSSNNFPYLPQCLRHVADIYYKQEEYEKAIQFVQAEKLYYETALVDTTHLQERLEERHSRDDDGSTNQDTDPGHTHPDVLRAHEYEGLAQMCLDRKQPQLALEYQAKATKLTQQSLGDEHPLTKKSLDFFTIVYGEVGKHQYSESVQKLTVRPVDDPVQSLDPNPEAPGTELRQRRKHEGESEVEKDDTTDKSGAETARDIQQKEERISRVLLLVLFGLCWVVLLCSMLYLYCKLGRTNCSAWRAEAHYHYMKFKYWYYSWTKDGGHTYG